LRLNREQTQRVFALQAGDVVVTRQAPDTDRCLVYGGDLAQPSQGRGWRGTRGREGWRRATDRRECSFCPV
jgi:regulator of RNase E activity RraA